MTWTPDCAADLADRDGNIYEQMKDLVEQFHAEHEYRKANRKGGSDG